MKTDKLYPRISQSLVLLVLTLVIMVAVNLLGIAFDLIFKTTIVLHPGFVGVTNLISLGLVIFFARKKIGIPFKELFPIKKISFSQLAAILVMTLGMSILLSELTNLTLFLIPMSPAFEAFMLNLVTSDKVLWSLFSVVLVAAFTEEFLFRGVILRGFGIHYSARKAIIVSAVFFGVFHLNPWQFPTAFGLGIVLAWWTLRSKNLLPALIGHGFNNLIPVMASRLAAGLDVPGYTSAPETGVQFQPVWFDLTGILLVVLGVLMIFKFMPAVTDSPAAVEEPALVNQPEEEIE